MKDSNATWIIFQPRIALLFILMLSQSFISCWVNNKFVPPKNLPNPDNVKRLIVFRASVVELKDELDGKKERNPNYTLLGITNDNKRIINISQPLSGNGTYVFEIEAADTGSITFLMGIERNIFGRNFYTDTTIHFKDLAMGNNYWHLNYYLQGFKKMGWVPMLKLKDVDISKDYFKSPPSRFRYALMHDLSADSIIYEKKKSIVSNQKSINSIYKRIMRSSISVDSILNTKKMN